MPCNIEEHGAYLYFYSEKGDMSLGYYENSDTVYAKAWNYRGTISNDLNRIDWEDGSCRGRDLQVVSGTGKLESDDCSCEESAFHELIKSQSKQCIDERTDCTQCFETCRDKIAEAIAKGLVDILVPTG